MTINEYAVDEKGQWYKWYQPLLKYVELKKEYWPTEVSANESFCKEQLYRNTASLYKTLLKKALLDTIYTPETEAILNGETWPQKAFTMIGRKRLDNLQLCVESVLENGVEGDFIETGVWRGGACILMKGLLRVHGSPKKVFVADSFQGLPEPDIEKYPIDANSQLHTMTALSVGAEEVKDNFRKFELLDSGVIFLEGWFKDTLSDSRLDKLAVIRLDGDLYQSTCEALTALYPKLQQGGFVIIDDYGWENCRKAVEDYRSQNNIVDPIVGIDRWGVYWKKESPTNT